GAFLTGFRAAQQVVGFARVVGHDQSHKRIPGNAGGLSTGANKKRRGPPHPPLPPKGGGEGGGRGRGAPVSAGAGCGQSTTARISSSVIMRYSSPSSVTSLPA